MVTWWYGGDSPHLAISLPLVPAIWKLSGEQARLVKTVKGSTDPAGCGDVGFRPSASPRGNPGGPEATMCTPMKGRVRPWQDGFGGRYRLGHRPVTLVKEKKSKKSENQILGLWWLNVQSGPCKPQQFTRSIQAWGKHGLRTKAIHEKW